MVREATHDASRVRLDGCPRIGGLRAQCPLSHPTRHLRRARGELRLAGGDRGVFQGSWLGRLHANRGLFRGLGNNPLTRAARGKSTQPTIPTSQALIFNALSANTANIVTPMQKARRPTFWPNTECEIS